MEECCPGRVDNISPSIASELVSFYDRPPDGHKIASDDDTDCSKLNFSPAFPPNVLKKPVSEIQFFGSVKILNG